MCSLLSPPSLTFLLLGMKNDSPSGMTGCCGCFEHDCSCCFIDKVFSSLSDKSDSELDADDDRDNEQVGCSFEQVGCSFEQVSAPLSDKSDSELDADDDRDNVQVGCSFEQVGCSCGLDVG